MRFLVWMLMFIGWAASAPGQTYTHKLLGRYTFVQEVQITPLGYYAYNGSLDPPDTQKPQYDLYVNGVNYSRDLIQEPHSVGQADIDKAGHVVWGVHTGPSGNDSYHIWKDKSDYTAAKFGADYQANWFVLNRATGQLAMQVGIAPMERNRFDTWIGDWNISKEVLGDDPKRGSGPTSITNDGRLFWGGQITGTPGDMYLETTNLTSFLGGSTRGVYDFVANDSGEYAFSATGSITGPDRNVFLGNFNLSTSVFGQRNWSGTSSMNAAGQLGWWGFPRYPFGPVDVFRNEQNLSSFLGPTRIVRQWVGLADDGRALWAGGPVGSPGHQDLFIDDRNYSDPILGSDGPHDAHPLEMTPGGHALWTGSGPNTAYHTDLFIDGVDISAGAIPDQSYSQVIGTTNDKGQVLWTVHRPDGMQEMWLSTPVPEPSVYPVALLFVPAVLGLRRRCGVRLG